MKKLADVLSPEFVRRFKVATAVSRGMCPECDEPLVKWGPEGAKVDVCPKCWKQPKEYEK